MDGLPIFNELFDKNPPEPLDKTATDGGFHVNSLNAKQGDDPTISEMYVLTQPKFDTFITDKTKYEKTAGDLMELNAAFDETENGLNTIFQGYQRKIAVLHGPDTDAYKALFWISITDMFKVGIEKKKANMNRFALVLEDYPDLATIKTDLGVVQADISTKQLAKATLESTVAANLLTARASQKIFCIEEQGNAGGLMKLFKATPYQCNQFYEVTDIKHYKPTETALAKKESHMHEFLPNTITVVSDILLSPSCTPSIKNLSLETVKIGTTFDATVKPAQKNTLASGKTFKKKINFIGDASNTLLVIDTMGCTNKVTMEIVVKNVTVKNK